MMRKIVIVTLVFLWSWSGAMAPVSAQKAGSFIPGKVKFKTKKKDGWFPDLNAAFNFSFAQSDGVIGVPDGSTMNFGLQLNGALTYSKGPHEWRSVLLLLHTQTKVPAIKPFLKSADKLDIETAYTYRLKKRK